MHFAVESAKHLTGSFFKRIIEKDKDAKIDIFNPSIGDFILKRYAKDLAMLESGFMSIANSQSLVTIESLEKNNVLKSHECEKICSSILKDICKSSFVNKSSYFIAHLCQLIIKWSSQPDLRNESLITAINFIFDENEESGSDHLYFVAGWAIENKVVSIEKILEKIKQCIPSITENSEIYAFSTLFEILSQKGISTRSIKNEIDSHVIKLFINDIYGHLDVHNAFSIFNGENFIETKENFEIEIKAKLEDLGINPSADDLTAIAESIDVFDALNNLRNDLDYAPTKKPIEDSSLDSVFIKDLFERHI